MKAEASLDERLAVSAVWREALAIIRRYPLATIVPAVVLAALADAPYYLLEHSGFAWEEILTFLTAAFAYYWKPNEGRIASPHAVCFANCDRPLPSYLP
jgi:hypothetical protein